LHCLESALKADAHDGGNWIRGDDGERYTQILRPLMKLLTAQVPDGCDILPVLQEGKIQYTPYQRLVQGETTEDYGNVVNCITSLAAAAGNEQLWKPLNHSLLEACGNEKRSEVRKSGVKSLLSIIHTLGEEYMVLLPECLPVLSELLEDEDEDIAGLTTDTDPWGEMFETDLEDEDSSDEDSDDDNDMDDDGLSDEENDDDDEQRRRSMMIRDTQCCSRPMLRPINVEAT